MNGRAGVVTLTPMLASTPAESFQHGSSIRSASTSPNARAVAYGPVTPNRSTLIRAPMPTRANAVKDTLVGLTSKVVSLSSGSLQVGFGFDDDTTTDVS